jgi:hypothetical protein
MIYTAEQFAAYLTARGATVTSSPGGSSAVVAVHHDGVRVHARFGINGRFQGASVDPGDASAYETLVLRQVVEALGLSAPAMTCCRSCGD